MLDSDAGGFCHAIFEQESAGMKTAGGRSSRPGYAQCASAIRRGFQIYEGDDATPARIVRAGLGDGTDPAYSHPSSGNA